MCDASGMTTWRSGFCWCAVGVLLPLVAACGGDDASGSTDGADVEGTVWVLDEFAGEPVPDGVEVTLEYDGANVAGSGGCNQYNGGASFDDGAVEISPGLATTRMLCEEPVMAVEGQYLTLLPTADGFSVDDGMLTMTAAGVTVLVFSGG
jgi:heat shock protein HslJ